jgi:hypothetical protein
MSAFDVAKYWIVFSSGGALGFFLACLFHSKGPRSLADDAKEHP